MLLLSRTGLPVLISSWIFLCITSTRNDCEDNGTCHLRDTHERCPIWAQDGLCETERRYMIQYCPESCDENYDDHGDDDDEIADDQDDAQNESFHEESCEDKLPRCEIYASVGECESNASEMLKNCAKSCGVCGENINKTGEQECKDENKSCESWATNGQCDENPGFMRKTCRRSCGTCKKKHPSPNDKDEFDKLQQASRDFGEFQRAEGTDALKTIEIIRKSVAYMQSDIESLPISILTKCLNRNELCSFWAAIGECEANAAYMVTNCAPACRTCNLIDMDSRCPKLENATPALLPGDLNNLFENLVRGAPGNKTLSEEEKRGLRHDKTPEYTVTVLSQPVYEPGKNPSIADDKKSPPWVVLFDDFTTSEECDYLIDLGRRSGYKRSRDVGAMKFDGSYESVESQRRTSSNSWCSHISGCREDEVAQRIHNRIGEVIGIPPENSEDMQLLLYQAGEYYRSHHDYIGHQRDRQCGPRILTFFLYLSNVEKGGGTRFPELNITVEPKRGRALLWPSVLNADPLAKDNRMMHEALPVEAGVKYGCNSWIHMFDYVNPQKNGCN